MSMTPQEQLKILAEQFSQSRASQCKKFPKKIWESAITLTKTISFKEVCAAISVQPAHLRKKMQGAVSSKKEINFVEVETGNTFALGDIVIDLETPSGFKAKIQGSSCFLNQLLAKLFQEISCSR